MAVSPFSEQSMYKISFAFQKSDAITFLPIVLTPPVLKHNNNFQWTVICWFLFQFSIILVDLRSIQSYKVGLILNKYSKDVEQFV